jgi:hypothetical protein
MRTACCLGKSQAGRPTPLGFERTDNSQYGAESEQAPTPDMNHLFGSGVHNPMKTGGALHIGYDG